MIMDCVLTLNGALLFIVIAGIFPMFFFTITLYTVMMLLFQLYTIVPI